MEGGAATAMEVLVKSLINVLTEEISRIQGLDQDAQQLKANLEMVQSYLNDAEKKDINPDVKTWLKNLEEVAFEADNVLDELKYHTLHKEVKAMKRTMDNSLSCFSSFHHTLRPRQMAIRIKEINTSFDSINKMATDLQLQKKLVDASAAIPVAAVETNSFTDDPIFVGRDEDVPKLVEVMKRNPEEKISILAVVGMGGMGKTTLTRKVFNHEKMKTRFGYQSWVHVSQTFDPLVIFKKFLASLPSQTDEAETVQGLLKKLEEALKAKTYLLVLDDIWNEDSSKWTYFIDSLSGVTSTKGNGIIITARSKEVASMVNPLETHHLNGLSDDDCWWIIKKMSIPSEYETIGRKIAKRCQGLPLAAKVVGGVLRHKSEEEWLSIEQKWLSDVEVNNIKGILRLSYDNLSSPELKKCFAYCSIFPKGQRMVKRELIELWMAEGFLQLGGISDMESVGDMFVNILLNNSLLQVGPRNDDKDEEVCVMHDLVHDLASSVLGSLKSRYVRHEDESSCISKESAKYLRTLFLEGKISKFKFSDFKCLHVLNFGSKSGSYRLREVEWSSIRKLVHLRKLNISRTEIEYLPDSIGELHHLQTLRADTRYLRKLPRTLKYLISLRHLYLYLSVRYPIKLPSKIGRLTSLQTLTYFTVGHENGCQIEELGCLKDLKGKLKIFYLEKVREKEEAKKANIFHNPNLVELTFNWHYGREESENDEKVLEGLQLHPYLKKLEIYGFCGKKFPLWTLKMAVRDELQGSWIELNKLVDITLARCFKCEEIPSLGHLPNLKYLYLRELINVKSINSSFYGVDYIRVCQDAIVVFPALERLKLDVMDNLKEWGEIQFPETQPHEVKVFPRLTQLDIERLQDLECLPDWLFHNSHNLSRLTILKCPKLRELPDGLHTLNSLEELTIVNCPNLKSTGNPSCSKGRSQGTLCMLWITHCKELVNLPHEMVESWAPSLETLHLNSLYSLKNLPNIIECLAKSDHLTKLKIAGVPRFMVTRSVGSWPFRRLRELCIDASVEWSRENSGAIKETVDDILGACNHSLVELELTGLDIWDCLPESIQNFTGVTELKLCNFGIEELPEWLENLSSLRVLSISRCKKLRHGGGIHALGRLTELKALFIDDCPRLSIDSEWCRNNNPKLQVRVDGHLI